jgi:type I restriction enzyme M protein
VDNNFVDAIIQLPKDLFFGTGIQTCILVLKKSKKDNKVLFVNAEREFERFGNKNKLRPEDIQIMLNAFIERKDEEYFSRVVSHEEIKDNNYSLSVTNYVESEDTREVIDIEVLNESLTKIIDRQSKLHGQIDEIVAIIEGQKN